MFMKTTTRSLPLSNSSFTLKFAKTLSLECQICWQFLTFRKFLLGTWCTFHFFSLPFFIQQKRFSFWEDLSFCFNIFFHSAKKKFFLSRMTILFLKALKLSKKAKHYIIQFPKANSMLFFNVLSSNMTLE